MAQVVDYASLVSYVVDIFDRSADTAFTGRIDTFIGLAEDTWTPTILNRRMETSATLTTASDGTVALPTDFYRLRSFGGQINGSGTNLPMIGPTANFGMFPINTGSGSQNAQIIGNTLVTSPPNGAISLTIDYWAQFVGLSSGNTTNWIILHYPTLYLYSVMAQAALWLQDPRFGSIQGLADDALDKINDKLGIEYYQNTDLSLDGPTP